MYNEFVSGTSRRYENSPLSAEEIKIFFEHQEYEGFLLGGIEFNLGAGKGKISLAPKDFIKEWADTILTSLSCATEEDITLNGLREFFSKERVFIDPECEGNKKLDKAIKLGLISDEERSSKYELMVGKSIEHVKDNVLSLLDLALSVRNPKQYECEKFLVDLSPLFLELSLGITCVRDMAYEVLYTANHPSDALKRYGYSQFQTANIKLLLMLAQQHGFRDVFDEVLDQVYMEFCGIERTEEQKERLGKRIASGEDIIFNFDDFARRVELNFYRKIGHKALHEVRAERMTILRDVALSEDAKIPEYFNGLSVC